MTQGVALNLRTEGARAEVIATATNSVVVGSSDSYESDLTALLARGTYILSYKERRLYPPSFQLDDGTNGFCLIKEMTISKIHLPKGKTFTLADDLPRVSPDPEELQQTLSLLDILPIA